MIKIYNLGNFINIFCTLLKHNLMAIDLISKVWHFQYIEYNTNYRSSNRVFKHKKKAIYFYFVLWIYDLTVHVNWYVILGTNVIRKYICKMQKNYLHTKCILWNVIFKICIIYSLHSGYQKEQWLRNARLKILTKTKRSYSWAALFGYGEWLLVRNFVIPVWSFTTETQVSHLP